MAARLRPANTGDKPLALAQISPLEGTLAEKHDPARPHILLNGDDADSSQFGLNLAFIVVGLAIMLGTFTRFSYLAGLGFILMVASAATIAMAMRASRADNPASFSVSGWMQDARERWRRER